MIGAVVRASLRNRLAVLVGAAALALLGAWAAATVEIDVLPDVTRPTLTVMTEAPGLAAEEVETLVTRPLELSLAGLPSLSRLRSSSVASLSVVNVELDWAAEPLVARQQATERLALAREQLPAGLMPQIQPISSIMGEIMLVAMTAGGATGAMELRSLADSVVRPRLSSIPGVSQVLVIGGEVRQMQIAPRTALLAGLDVSVSEIERAVAGFGLNSGGGAVDQRGSEYVIRTFGAVPDPAALGNVVVATRDGVPVLLRQVADVGVGAKPVRGSAGFNGGDAVILSVQKQPSADTRALTQAVAEALAELQRRMPPGVNVEHLLFRQADFISAALGNLGHALLESAIVVALVLLILLGNVRTTVISIVAIPLSLLSAVIVFRVFGVSLNAMTLGGFAIAMGELVDDAVVGVENVFRRLRENAAAAAPRPTLAVIADASEEVRSGILYATAVVVLVLLPLLAIAGVEGRLLAPLAIAYLVALLASLVTALTVTPVLCLLLLPGLARRVPQDTPVIRLLKRALAGALPWAFRNAGPVIGAAGAAVGLALVMLLALPRSLMPAFNEGSLTVELSAPAGITLADSTRLGQAAEQLLLQVPDVVSVGRRTGRAELDEHAQGIETSEIDVVLRPDGRAREETVAEIRRKLSALPAAVNVGQPISHRIDHLFSGVRAEIVIKLFGDDLDALAAAAERLAADLARVPGLVDVQLERRSRIPTIDVRPDERRTRLYGTTPAAVAGSVSALANGRTLSQLLDSGRRVEVALRLADRERTSAGLARLLIETPSGRVPLKLVADVSETDGMGRIEREDGRRRVAVYANLQGTDVARTVAAVREHLARQQWPAGTSLALEGTFAGQAQAVGRILGAGLLSLAAIFLLLLGRYRSPALALIVMGSVPLSLIGGVIALVVTGLPLSLASVVGFITLAGIAARNGILKISHYLNLALAEGAGGDALIIRGSLERLTPVLLTAAATSFALLPLLADPSAAGREILYPVAVVVFGGLLGATMLDTLLTPVLFRQFGARALERLLASRRRTDRGPSF